MVSGGQPAESIAYSKKTKSSIGLFSAISFASNKDQIKTAIRIKGTVKNSVADSIPSLVMLSVARGGNDV